MIYTEELIREKIATALEELDAEEPSLMSNDTNERSITHRLALYLDKSFPGYVVDCEYNRNDNLPKELDFLDFGEINEDDTEAKTVYPDIIVHKRTEKDNLLVIEVKKYTSTVDNETNLKKCKIDLKKIGAFISDTSYEYKFGCFIRITDPPTESDVQIYTRNNLPQVG